MSAVMSKGRKCGACGQEEKVRVSSFPRCAAVQGSVAQVRNSNLWGAACLASGPHSWTELPRPRQIMFIPPPRLTGEESAELPSAVLLGLCKFLPETAEPRPALVWPSSSVDSYHRLPACRIYPSPFSRTGWELFQNLRSKVVAGESGREGFYV